MEPAIKQRFSDEVLASALSRYGISAGEVEPLDAFENFIYQCRHEGADRILRISHSFRRSASDIAAEIDWVNYLAGNGVNACRAVPSLTGGLHECLGESDEGNDYFIAALFDRAPGRRADDETWQPPLFETMGRTMGRIHALTRDYRPIDPSFRRPQWHEEIEGMAEKFLPADQAAVIDKINARIEETLALPKSADTFGLVHIDFHRGNFFVDDGRMWLFDFDDCQYTWFADDIAIALFYAVSYDCSSDEDLAAARRFLRHFLIGYREEHAIEAEWLARLPMFLKRRESDLYTVVYRSMGPDSQDPFASSFMKRRREKIENDVPYVDLDFSEF